MIRDIEARSGAQIEIDQLTKDQGYSTVYIRGTEPQKKTAYGFVVAEVMKAADSAREPMDVEPIGVKEEVLLDVQYVGWVKGPKGKIISDICNSSGARVDVNQTSRQVGQAVVKIYGTPEGVQNAKQMIATELSKVNPEAAAGFAGDMPILGVQAQRSHTTTPASLTAATAGASFLMPTEMDQNALLQMQLQMAALGQQQALLQQHALWQQPM